MMMMNGIGSDGDGGSCDSPKMNDEHTSNNNNANANNSSNDNIDVETLAITTNIGGDVGGVDSEVNEEFSSHSSSNDEETNVDHTAVVVIASSDVENDDASSSSSSSNSSSSSASNSPPSSSTTATSSFSSSSPKLELGHDITDGRGAKGILQHSANDSVSTYSNIQTTSSSATTTTAETTSGISAASTTTSTTGSNNNSSSTSSSSSPEQTTSMTTDTRRRVKLYMLNANRTWDDRGTGHVSSSYVDRLNGVSLLVKAETDGSVLLESRILADTAYQKQQDTLIVWSEGENYDLALSFQERVGCEEIWAKICQVQGKDPSVEITQDIMEDEDNGNNKIMVTYGTVFVIFVFL